jgi:CRISPR/Cas system CSM-associated protein Csm2 small subunit
MNPVAFTMNKGGKTNACFEWVLDENNERIGCYMAPEKKEAFKDVLCLILKKIADDDNVKDHLDFCQELQGIPVYKKSSDEKSSSKISTMSSKENLNEVLMK